MNSNMLRLIAAAAMIATGSAAQAGDFDTLKVAGISNFEGMIAGPGNSGAMLSLDGSRLFHFGTRQSCVYDLTGAAPVQVVCGELSERVSGPEDMLWAPDGAHLVMPTYRDAFEAFRDTDIKVMDPKTLAITNLTDDGVDGSIMKRGPATMDTAAQWLDADTLLFMRIPFGKDGVKAREPGSLMSIDLGGEPQELVKPITDGKGIPYAMDVAPDGSAVAYAVQDQNPDLAGIYLVDLASPTPKRIAPMSEIGGVPSGLAYSADGKYLAVLGRDPKGYIAVTLVEMATGTATPLLPNLQIGGVAWSPSGSALAYLVRAPDGGGSQPSGLYLAEPPSAPGRLLKAGPFMPPFCCSQPVTWATNDTMVLGNMDKMDQPFLIRFSR